MFRRRSGIPSNIRGIERFVWGLYSAPIHSSSFRFWGAATSGRLGRVTVLPQLKVDRLCSVVDGTAEFDPQVTCREEISPDHVVGGRLQREWHGQV